ncbi:MAG: YIP1 family protein [Hyphomonadaceae bacterium]|nr:YIP1 family protein [Hyphomonadaceae bacterium]
MTAADELHGERAGLFVRVRNILIRPQSEWRRIAAEDHAPLLRNYVVPLALLGAIVGFVADVAYGGHFAISAALLWKAISAALYVMFAVFSVLAAATLVRILAPRFGAERNPEAAHRLAAYSATPILIAALGALAPPIAGGLVVAGIVYALALLAFGVQPLMQLRDPDGNVPRFTFWFAMTAAVTAALVAAFVGPLLQSGRSQLNGAVATLAPTQAIPEMQRRSAAESTIERLTQTNASALPANPMRLAEQLPHSLPGGFERQSVTSTQAGGVSRADADYRAGPATLSVSVIQFARDVNPAALAGELAIRPDGPQAGGYARTQLIDGRFYAEEVGVSTSRYVVIGRGVIVITQGDVTMDQARGAVETIGLQRLESMFGR